MLELTDAELSHLVGGMDPLSIVFGLAALTATLINMINNNPDYYSSGSWYDESGGDNSATLHYYESLPAGLA